MSPQAKQLCHLHAQPSQGQSCHRQKKSCIWACRVPLVVSSSLRPCKLRPARLLCQVGVFPSKNLERMGQYWFPYRSIFPAALADNPLSIWCCQNPFDPSSCTTSTPGPHRGKPTSFREASGANPSGRSTCRGGNKITTETQGHCD